jgi:N-acetylglucosamine-6-phosphate deacetylase
MTTAIVNARAVLPDRIEDGCAILIEEGRIAAVGREGDLPAAALRFDAGGATVIPGLVDIHTHGALGHTFNEPTAEAFGAILRANAAMGVTSVVGTLAPASFPDMTACLGYARGWMATERRVATERAEDTEASEARLLGMHLESPYVNPAQKGALDPVSLRAPADDAAGAEELLAYADALRLFVLAPELPGAFELIERLAGRGVVVAAGHSMAKDEQVAEAMRHGLSHVTHLWSAMSSTVREGPWRKPGLLEAGLVFEGLTVEMIADNRHLPPTLMKLAVKCIPPERLCVISDATSGAGLAEGSEFRMGAMAYEVRDGVGMMFDRTAFGGSTTLLGRMLPILTGVVGVSLLDAVTMCSRTPARVVGWGDRVGSIEAGKVADLVVLDDGLLPARVMLRGVWLD